MSGIYIDDVDYSYYDYPNYARSNLNNTLNYNVPSWPSLIRVLLVMLLRIGCVLIHIGSVPVNNVNLILLQNVIDFCWVTFTYLLIGSVLAYTGDSRGVVGEGHWVGDNSVDKDEVMIGWSAVVIAAAICTCGVVGRMHTVGYLIIGFLLASLIQPLIIHWVWTSKGWIRTNVLSQRGVEFYDYSGSTVVHIVGGLTGLIGCMTLGRRILRLDAIDDASIAVGSSGTVFAGQLLVFIGLQCLSMPNVHLGRDEMRNKRQCNAYINNLLAGSSCSVIVILIHFVSTTEEFNHWTVMRCVQAIVAGLVMISAGTDIYYPSQTIILGAIASIVFYLTSRHVFHSAIEDYCNIIATHLVCAILGSILVPFFNVSSNTVDQVLLNVGWQLICLFIIIIFVGITMYVAFALLQFSGLLRNRSEYLNHLRANIAEARTGREKTFLERLFQMDEDPIYLQPGTASAEQRRSSEIRA